MASAQVEAAPLLASADPGEREASRLHDINQAERDRPKTATAAGVPASVSSASSAPVVPLPAHHTVVPAYPYNVSMSPFIPGSSSNRSESYFEQHVPDDSNVQTRLPSICVDYLSHDWQEDDIWSSWKAMTKHKSEIANGVRLENASWRTWAKQRGKLKTISPETLNWLKDSDVTWLYGPLHTAVDPVPAPKTAKAEDRLGLATSHTSPNSGSKTAAATTKSKKPQLAVKPILKHRSLSDILSVPHSSSASPVLENFDSYENSEDEGQGQMEDASMHSGSGSGSSAENTPRGDGAQSPGPQRPPVQKSKSLDTSARQGGSILKRKGSVDSHGQSPPRNNQSGNGGRAGARTRTTSLESGTGGRRSPLYEAAEYDLSSSSSSDKYRPGFRRSSSHDASGHHHHHSASSGAYPSLPKKRHISFNHRVEQCISLDADDIQKQQQEQQAQQQQQQGRKGVSAGGNQQPYSNQLHRYGSSSVGSSMSSSTSGSSSDSEEDDDDEDVLTFRSSSPKSPSFMKPFLASPTDPNGPASAASAQGGRKIPYGTHGPYGQTIQQPHTIAKLAPTTLKEFELLPGPTPIVVFEDGKITALYGTEEDYIFDAEEHRGMGSWIPPNNASIPENAVEDDSTEDEEEDTAPTEVAGSFEIADSFPDRVAPKIPDNDEHYNAFPAKVASPMQDNPVTSSTRYADPERADTSLVSGQGVNAGRSDYFGGPEPAFADDFDGNVTTASQAKYGSALSTSNPNDFSRGAAPGSMQASNATNSNSLAAPSSASSSAPTSASSSGATSPSILASSASYFGDTTNTNVNIALSSSPSGRGGIPGKSILKKGRDPQGPGSSEYYPPLPPASTRASRAHATMFDENGEEIIQSPKSRLVSLPDGQDPQQQQPSAETNITPSNPLPSPSLTTPPVYTEPVRGRSISRGSSSSSLYERAVASGAVADPYRTRSASGTSVSPVASYSPPYTASLNSLGAGTAVLPNESSANTASRGRIQTARPVSGGRRPAILAGESSDEDSDDDDSSSTEAEDADEAANMDIQLDLQSDDSIVPKDSVSFARSSHHTTPSSTSQAMKQSHRAAFDDEDRGEILESVERNKEDEEGFDSRPASKAADVGRSQGSTKTTTRQNLAAQQRAEQLARMMKAKDEEVETLLPEDEGTASAGRLFDSPYMPSSPQFMSATNIPALAHAEFQQSQAQPSSMSSTLDEGTEKLQWADKPPDNKPSAARSSLLRNLSPHSKAMKKASPKRVRIARTSSSRAAAGDESDELSDPASNGYSYGFDLSEEEDEGKGVVGRAVDLVGALWNVGRGMVWGKSAETEA